MTTAQTPETSVMFSLAELADIEQERLREEATERASRERDRMMARQAALEAERAAEVARVAAEQERRAAHERQKAEAKARSTARERAEVEVARIAAEAKVRLEAENANRAHELEVLRVKNDSGRATLRHALAGVIGLVVLAGSATGWAVNGHLTKIEQESQRLREDRWAVSQAYDEAMASQLASLDRRHAALGERATAKNAEKARLRAEAARSAIEAGGVDAPKLAAFAEALDALGGVVAANERLAAHDQRLLDLTSWATATGKTKALDVAKRAAAAAKNGDGQAEARYVAALDGLSAALATEAGGTRRVSAAGTTTTTTTTTKKRGIPCTNRHDPMCGPDGMLLETH